MIHVFQKFVNAGQLESEIQNSNITIALESIVTSGQTTTVTFKAVLPPQDLVILEALVDDHVIASIINEQLDVRVTESEPFAKPSYRTKRNATNDWITCPENDVTVIDFLLTEEKYVSGGRLLLKDVLEGDYVTAEVCDKDGIIPAPYRAALCESHPTVSKYIMKEWLVPCTGYGFLEINTYPLNAQIPAGLYLRINFHTSALIGNRKCAVNYFLTKKL
jgi:hypothetical protein